MIYLSPDYLLKYSDTLAEIISLAKLDNYADDFIMHQISHSQMIQSLEQSDITEIAFSSSMKLYRTIFQDSKAYEDEIALFSPYYWIGEMYLHIFLKYHLTFETIFTYFPIQLMEKQYYLYHEMSRDQFDQYVQEVLEESPLSIYLKKRKMSCTELSERSGVNLVTIRSLKNKTRDIKKVQFEIIDKLAVVLRVNPRSLLDHIILVTDEVYEDIEQAAKTPTNEFIKDAPWK